MSIRLFFTHLVPCQADQDREIAAGADWIKESDAVDIAHFWRDLQEAKGAELRKFSDAELTIVRNLACIGFFEVAKSYMARHVNEEAED